jgi:biotin transport system substrate-specific component
MSSLAPALPTRPVLADLLPGDRVRTIALVVGAALLTAASAQVVIPLGFSPVPITGQTFAVLLTGAALGPMRGAAGQGLYLLLGGVGLPFFADASGGWQVISGATGGYLVGFVLAAALVGWLARRGVDRTPHGTAAAFIAGSLVIYAVGVPWLAVVIDVPLAEAIRLGMVPFLPGDVFKAALAAGVLPTAWLLVRRADR